MIVTCILEQVIVTSYSATLNCYYRITGKYKNLEKSFNL